MTIQNESSRFNSSVEAPFLATWIGERKEMLVSIGIGTFSWPVVMGAAWSFWPASVVIPMTDRLAYAFQLAAIPAVLLLLMVVFCMRLFDTTEAENPLAGAESERFKINQRVISNTIEQGLIFVPILIALSIRLTDEHLKLLPAAMTVWVTGRLLFWAGYHIAPRWRAPGFDWTMLTAILAAGWLIYTVV